MQSSIVTRRGFQKIRFVLLPALLAGALGFFLSHDTNQPVHAFSAGPPAGYTGAPNEEPEACAECHVPDSAGSGQINIIAPQTYIPGQTYQVSVTNTNADPSRLRWGFQLTVLDNSDEKAGNLQNTDGLTQVLDNQGPGGARQYIEHTAAGTFAGQQMSASWTFNWTAPATDIGPVTFYAAGNHANNDGNTSGDFIYKTFVASSPPSTTPDFAISVAPSSRNVIPGGSAGYVVTVTPLAGFTGTVNLSASGLPSGVGANFSPAAVIITDATSKTSNLTLTSGMGTPLGNHSITINSQSGSLMHSAQVSLNVVSASSVDLAVGKTASPNPGQVGVNLTYRITVTNNGPATATNVTLTDTLPAGINFSSVTTSQGSCSGTGPVNCSLGSLAMGGSAVVTIVVVPTGQGQLQNMVSVSASESDFNSSNNSATITTFIQAPPSTPTVIDNNLMVSTVVSGLDQPISLAFIGLNDFFILEKATGRVRRVVNGAIQGTVLDLAVNSASERGLLGIALHPKFAQNGYVYLFWTESTTGSDTTNADATTLLGNRVDRYVWNGASLTFDQNIIRLRALQQDAGQPSRGNHNGGVLRFGLDGKLYILFGDVGRRGFLQNLPTGGPVPDDQHGGPEPDDAHMSGVILRLNEDGTAPSDNPFFNAATGLTGQAAANIKKIFAYGIRNGFGMDIDPVTGNLWQQENGDDAFDEMNRIVPGFNGGWIQVMGPSARVAEFKSIEMTYGAGSLQQNRWPPSNIASTPQAALARLYMLPGAQYTEPEFSWRYAVAPSALGFVRGRGLGAQYEANMLVAASRTTLENGFLFRFRFNSDRQHFSFTDQRLNDLVADNLDKFDIAESESLLFGSGFGISTDIQTSPSGSVFVVSLSNGAIYEIKQKPEQLFVATLTGAQEVPANSSTATGTATILLSPDETRGRVALNFSGLSTAQTDAHIHGPAAAGVNAPPIFPLPLGQLSDFQITLTAQQVADLKAGLHYINVHTSMFPGGEIRGQFSSPASATSLQFASTAVYVNEGQGSATVSVTRAGSTSAAVSVDFITTDGTAINRTDYITSAGTLNFAAGETVKSFKVPIVDDLYIEGSETLTLALRNAGGGAFLGSPNTATLTIFDNDTTPATSNPLDQAGFFVNQHYLDFLNREPDAGGLGYWTNQITQCGNDTACIINRRVGVSGAFFVETEFQEGGNFVYRLYKGSLGRQPTYAEFTIDRGKIIEGPNLEATKVALVNAFVARAEFRQRYPDSQTNEQFVNKLFDTALLVPFTAERQQQITAMNGGKTRAQVVRDVVDIPQFRTQEFNPSFVLMQYFGYLRRDPEPGGYAFWLNVLTNLDPNNYRGMICAFITSAEYQQRFSPVVTRNDQECR